MREWFHQNSLFHKAKYSNARAVSRCSLHVVRHAIVDSKEPYRFGKTLHGRVTYLVKVCLHQLEHYVDILEVPRIWWKHNVLDVDNICSAEWQG